MIKICAVHRTRMGKTFPSQSDFLLVFPRLYERKKNFYDHIKTRNMSLIKSDLAPLLLSTSMHDYSRDIMLATSQEQIELRMAFNAAEVKANALNVQLKKLDEIQQKTDELLYQMIPRSIADRLRSGKQKKIG